VQRKFDVEGAGYRGDSRRFGSKPHICPNYHLPIAPTLSNISS
jgi:hypothetical protein